MPSSQRHAVTFNVILPKTYAEVKRKTSPSDIRDASYQESKFDDSRVIKAESRDVIAKLKSSTHGQVKYRRERSLSEDDLPPNDAVLVQHQNAVERVCSRSEKEKEEERVCSRSEKEKGEEERIPLKRTMKRRGRSKKSPPLFSKNDNLILDPSILEKTISVLNDMTVLNDSMAILSMEKRSRSNGATLVEAEIRKQNEQYQRNQEESRKSYEQWQTELGNKLQKQVEDLRTRDRKKDDTIQSELRRMEQFYKKKYEEGKAIIKMAEQNQKMQEEEAAQREKQANTSWSNMLTYEATTLEMVKSAKTCITDPKVDPEIELLLSSLLDLSTTIRHLKSCVSGIYQSGQLDPNTASMYEADMYKVYMETLKVVEVLNVAIKRVNAEIAQRASADLVAKEQTVVAKEQTVVTKEKTVVATETSTPVVTKLSNSTQQRTEEEQNATAAATAGPAVSEDVIQSNVISKHAFQTYLILQEKLKEVENEIKNLVCTKDKDITRMKSSLKLVTITPINSISASNNSHMKSKVKQLSDILSGKKVKHQDKDINPGFNSLTLNYCFFVASSKFVDQACEQVAFSDTLIPAFSIATVLTGIWQTHPKLGELFLAHLHRKCPYIIPAHWPKHANENTNQYMSRLGYLVDENGKPEELEKFLLRMEGCVKLYAAILQCVPPYKDKPHPHGLGYGWLWLTRILNMEPMPNITATILEAFLKVAGNALHLKYKSQFLKQLDLLYASYLPKLETITNAKNMGPITRLKLFLEKVKKERAIPVPDGRITVHICS